MSHTMEIPQDLSPEKFVLGARAGRWVSKFVGVGAIALAIAIVLGLTGTEATTSRFLHAYLTSYMYFTSICLGALFFVIIMQVTSAGWSATTRRIAELITMNLPLMAVLSLPILASVFMGNATLFSWVDPHIVDNAKPGLSHLIETKEAYLNPTFFTIRLAIYFLIWIGVANWFRKNSMAQDVSGDPTLTNRMKKFAAPAIPLFALSIAFFSLDMLMSLDPTWFSTIFGVYYFAGSFGVFMALLGILSNKLGAKDGILSGFIRDEHFHDIGKLTFAFVMFWGYIAFSQYILIWYANIPEETAWYHERETLYWGHVGVLFAVRFAIPFLGLMSKHMKRVPGRMIIFGGWIMAMHYYDMFFLTMPSQIQTLGYLEANATTPEAAEALAAAAHSFESMPFGILEILCLVGMGGIFCAGIARAFSKNSILAVRDPRMTESLHFHNP